MYYQPEINFTPDEVLLYSRKSQSDDPSLTVEEVLAKHERLLDRWAVDNLGAVVPEENKFREVVSGESLSGRPKINKVLRLIESPLYKAVLIVEPQRLTRGDSEDIGRIMKILKHTNTLVLTETRVYDLRDEYDWDALEIELRRGNDYLKYYKKIQLRGKLLSLSKGNYISSVAPYGYEKIHVMDGKDRCPTLKEKKEEADVVRMIFDLFVNHGYGRQKICNHLDSLGIKPPKTKYWSDTTIKVILSNIHYIGKVHWNWRKTVIEVEDGQFVKRRPMTNVEEHLVYEGRHDGIVSEELFNAAQEKIGKQPRVKKGVKVRNSFSGLIYCAQCGRALVYKHAKNKDGKVRSAPRLMCPEQKHCGTGSCLYDDMIEKVCTILDDCIEDFEIRINSDTGDSIKLHNELIKNLEKKMTHLKEKELAQWEKQADPDPAQRMPPEIFKQLNEKLLAEKAEIRQALCKARESMPEPVNYEDRIATFREALAAMQDPAADAELKNRLLKACIERIDYKRATLKRERGVWSAPPIELDVKLKV